MNKKAVMAVILFAAMFMAFVFKVSGRKNAITNELDEIEFALT